MACSPAFPLEVQHEQDPAVFCDFVGRDQENTVENVFIGDGDAVAGQYRVRVIGFSVRGNEFRPEYRAIEAKPNFVDSDGLPVTDIISDTDQRYALVASGSILTARGHLFFENAIIGCEGVTAIVLETTTPIDPVNMFVTIRTSVGDCDRVDLVQIGPTTFRNIVQVHALDHPAPTLGCSNGALDGDGRIMIGDDGMMWATFSQPSGGPGLPALKLQASVRTRCRGVTLVVSATYDDPCSGTPGNDLFEINEPGVITVPLAGDGLGVIAGLWGDLVPADDRIHVTPTGAEFGTPPSFAEFRVFADPTGTPSLLSDCLPASSMSQRFRLDIHGEDGFEDRVYFDLDLQCVVSGVGDAARPGEVVDGSLMVTKGGVGAVDLLLNWGPSSGASTFNLWRGDVELLHLGVYNHEIPDNGVAGPPANFCDVTVQFSQIADAALPACSGLGCPRIEAFYFLATGEAACAAGSGTVDGPWGHPDALSPHPDADSAEIPRGRRSDLDCQ